MFASQCQTINQERHHPLSKFSRSPAPFYMPFYNFLYLFLTRIFDRIFSHEQKHRVCRSLILIRRLARSRKLIDIRGHRMIGRRASIQKSSMSVTASWLDLFTIAQASSLWQQQFLPNYLSSSRVDEQI